MIPIDSTLQQHIAETLHVFSSLIQHLDVLDKDVLGSLNIVHRIPHRDAIAMQILKLGTVTPPNTVSTCPVHRILRSVFFCSAVKVDGNLTLYLTIKSPLWSGFLLRGMPRPGYVSELPGCVGPAFSITMDLPSIVVTVRFHPVKASLRSSSTWWMRFSLSRVYSRCGFCNC